MAVLTSNSLANNTITTEKIVDNAVTTAKIANSAVTNAKLDISALTNVFASTTSALTIPTGTTAQRPTAVNGMLRLNTTTGTVEAYANSSWSEVFTQKNSRFSSSSCGSLLPSATNSYDLGSSSFRWNNLYVNDLNLSNGIGDYTIVEGEEDLFIYNNKNNKVYKFALIEIDPKDAPAKQ